MGEEFRLHPLHQSDMARADLVLVHGLKGHPRATWTHKDGQKCWPEWLALKYPQSNIWLADYGTSLNGWLQPALPVEDIGRALLSHAADLKIGTRPIHWVGHSMGGLVIKQLLCQARMTTQPNWNAISIATRAVTFLGTPHHGADLPVWKSYFEVLLQAVDTQQLAGITTFLSQTVSRVFGDRHSQVDAMMRHAPALGRLNAEFSEWLTAAQSPGQPFLGRNYTEGLPTFKVMMVVPQAAASLHNPLVQDIPVQADHFAICKFASEREPVFVGIDEDFRALLAWAAQDKMPPRVILVHEVTPQSRSSPPSDRPPNLTDLAWRKALADCTAGELTVLARGLIEGDFLVGTTEDKALEALIVDAFERQEPIDAMGRLQSCLGESRTTLFVARGGEAVRQDQITQVLTLLLIHAAALWSDVLIGDGDRDAALLQVPCAQNSLAVVIAAHALFGHGVRVSRHADGRVEVENALDAEALPAASAMPPGRQDGMQTLSEEVRRWLERTQADPQAGAVKSPLKTRLDTAQKTLHARPVVIDKSGVLSVATVDALREQLGIGVATLARENQPPHIDPRSWDVLCGALEGSLLRAASAPPPPPSASPASAASAAAAPAVQVNFTVQGSVGQVNSTTGTNSSIHANHTASPVPAASSLDRLGGAFLAFELVLKVWPDRADDLEHLGDLRALIESRDAGPTATRQLPRLVQRLKAAKDVHPELRDPWIYLTREVQAHWPDVSGHFR